MSMNPSKNLTNNRTKTNNKHSNGRNNKLRKTTPDSQPLSKSNVKPEYGEFKDGRYVSGTNSTPAINPIEQERQQKFTANLPKPVDVQIAPSKPNAFHRNPSPPGLLSPSHFSNPQLNNPQVTSNNPPSTVRAAPSAPQIYLPIDPQSLFAQFQFSTSPPKSIATPVSVNATCSSNSVQAVSPTKSPTTRSYSIQGSPGLHFAGGSYTNAPDPRMVPMPSFSMVPS